MHNRTLAEACFDGCAAQCPLVKSTPKFLSSVAKRHRAKRGCRDCLDSTRQSVLLNLGSAAELLEGMPAVL